MPSLKNSDDEQQRRDDEEEAEVDEVLAEVGGAARRGQALRPHRPDGQAQRERIDRVAQPGGQRRALARRAAAASAAGTRIDVIAP